MGFNACGSVHAAEIDACGLTKSVLVGRQRSVLMGLDSCGGDWCLWGRADLTVRDRIRKIRRRRSCLWGGGDLTHETVKGRRSSSRERKKKKKWRRDKRLV